MRQIYAKSSGQCSYHGYWAKKLAVKFEWVTKFSWNFRAVFPNLFMLADR